jgi:hypothetical protein
MLTPNCDIQRTTLCSEFIMLMQMDIEILAHSLTHWIICDQKWYYQSIDYGYNWNDGDILYSELETLLHRETSSAVAIYCFGPQKTAFISGLIDRTVTDITLLGCPELSDIIFPTISCTFACHNNSKYVCALRSAYSLAQWLNFSILSLQYAKCPPQPECH